MKSQYIDIELPHRSFTLEYQWINPHLHDAPLLVFLHEGLGSVAMWKDYPQRLCDAGHFRGLMYSRPGYGRSTPRPASEKWPLDYLQQQAVQVLPAFLQAVGVGDAKPWLFGHSDGASIALVYAATYPAALSGAVLLAPHVFVEEKSLQGIVRTLKLYRTTGLKRSLARYHADPDSGFFGWSDAWLSAEFKSWNIEDILPNIRAPLLVIQGHDDEYATMEQLDRIEAAVPSATMLKLAACGHSPHKDQPKAVGDAVLAFVANHAGGAIDRNARMSELG